MTEAWLEAYARYQAKAKELGVTPLAYAPNQKIDWSTLDKYRDMPVKDRPKTYKVGGGTGRR